jgi:hypothetical protein
MVQVPCVLRVRRIRSRVGELMSAESIHVAGEPVNILDIYLFYLELKGQIRTEKEYFKYLYIILTHLCAHAIMRPAEAKTSLAALS